MKRKIKYWCTVIGIFILGAAMYIGGCWWTASYSTIAGVPILNYHQVNDVNYSPLTMQVPHFEQQMAYLHDNGYHTITLDELYAFLEEGKALPDKAVVITFDDGYQDNYKNALPILKKYGMKATVFMIGDSVGAPRFMTADELRTMQQNGIDVESHTYSHKDLTKMDQANVESELMRSRLILEDVLHKPVRYVAYPCGFYNDTVLKATKDTGYRLGLTVTTGNARRGDNPLALQRLAVFEGDDPFLSMRIRLHMADLVGSMWKLRDALRDHGYVEIASKVPLI